MNRSKLFFCLCSVGLIIIAVLTANIVSPSNPAEADQTLESTVPLPSASMAPQQIKLIFSQASAGRAPSKSPELESVVLPSQPTAEVKPSYPKDALELLACLIYQEAGSDACCDGCRRRVADVALNRVESEYFPDTLEEVLTQPNQYGKFSQTGVIWPERAKTDAESHAVERAYRIAEEVLTGHHSGVYGEGYIWQAEFEQGTYGFWCCGIYYGKGVAG